MGETRSALDCSSEPFSDGADQIEVVDGFGRVGADLGLSEDFVDPQAAPDHDPVQLASDEASGLDAVICSG
jgi:hypothetical protein